MSPLRSTLILASGSPRRRQLLEAAGYRFQVIAPRDTAECGVCSRESPPETVARLAYQKAADVAAGIAEGLILGADTLVECRGHVLGKPHNQQHARQMLELLSGQIHHVYTGICLWRRPDDHVDVKVDTTKLRMNALSTSQLESYLESGHWQGKAGAFGYQDRHDWLTIVSGSESNVVGLPMQLLEEMLAEITGSSADR